MSISDFIENYIKELVEEKSYIDLKRNEMAEYFHCVPSQINYVLSTRFTVQRGYHVESRRGEGGYVRVLKVCADSKEDLLKLLTDEFKASLTETEAKHVIDYLHENDFISLRESHIVRAMISDSVLSIPNQAARDILRANMLNAILLQILIG